jgi:hypothetical protein
MLRTEDLPMFSSKGMAGLGSTAGSLGGGLAWLPQLATAVAGIEPEQFHSGSTLLTDRPRTGARAVTGTASAIARSIMGGGAFGPYAGMGGGGAAAGGGGGGGEGSAPANAYSAHFLSGSNSAGPGAAYLAATNEQLSLRFSMSLDLEDPSAGGGGAPQGGH